MKRATTCCTGECNQGRACPLLVDRAKPAAPPRAPIEQRPEHETARAIVKAVIALAFIAFGLWVWPR